jgi:hypothetical protein
LAGPLAGAGNLAPAKTTYRPGDQVGEDAPSHVAGALMEAFEAASLLWGRRLDPAHESVKESIGSSLGRGPVGEALQALLREVEVDVARDDLGFAVPAQVARNAQIANRPIRAVIECFSAERFIDLALRDKGPFAAALRLGDLVDRFKTGSASLSHPVIAPAIVAKGNAATRCRLWHG